MAAISFERPAPCPLSSSQGDESLGCAAKYDDLMSMRPDDESADVWAAVAVHSSWLSIAVEVIFARNTNTVVSPLNDK